jgi:hypothetical protein
MMLPGNFTQDMPSGRGPMSRPPKEGGKYRPLDFVLEPGTGEIGLVEAVHAEEASIYWIGVSHHPGLKTAWWNKDQLMVIDSLPRVLANIAGAGSHEWNQGDEFFPIHTSPHGDE